jgi:hypothetical protein
VTKREADAAALAWFEKCFEERHESEIADLLNRAAAGDSWILGQLHLRTLSGDHLAMKAYAAVVGQP